MEKKQPIAICYLSKHGKEKGSFCTACYLGWGLIFDGQTVKVDKCLYCN